MSTVDKVNDDVRTSSDDSTRGEVRAPRVDRGEAGRVLRELRAKDFIFTVLETERVEDAYVRLRLSGNGFLRTFTPYPTMWVRLWFEDESGSGEGHQRAYTLVDPDVDTDTFWLEFALHDGAACRWALAAEPGDAIEASLYGSEPTLPGCDEIDTHLLVGDAASLPAINSLLDALSPAPAVVVVEYAREGERHLPVRTRQGDEVIWVSRKDDGRAVIEEVDVQLAHYVGASKGADESVAGAEDGQAAATSRVFAWAACDTVTTRTLTKRFKEAGLPRHCIKTLGYWLPPSEYAAAR